jgi:hypothetical protein
VYADTRTHNHLLPFKFPEHALKADLNVFRRAKSDEEIASIQRMAKILQASREHAHDEQDFRGTADSLDYRHASQQRAGNEFTMKRYGLQDDLGRTVELSSVEPHTLDWKERMLRVDAGCRAVEEQLREGATGMDIDKTFRSHLDPTVDVIYGSVLHHTGYQPWEDDLEVDVLKKYDVLTISPIVGDERGNSVPYMHSVHAITDQQFRGVTSNDALFRGKPKRKKVFWLDEDSDDEDEESDEDSDDEDEESDEETVEQSKLWMHPVYNHARQFYDALDGKQSKETAAGDQPVQKDLATSLKFDPFLSKFPDSHAHQTFETQLFGDEDKSENLMQLENTFKNLIADVRATKNGELHLTDFEKHLLILALFGTAFKGQASQKKEDFSPTQESIRLYALSNYKIRPPDHNKLSELVKNFSHVMPKEPTAENLFEHVDRGIKDLKRGPQKQQYSQLYFLASYGP